MKKILVACGTGMSTSTMIAQKLQDYLATEGIHVVTTQCSLSEIPLNKSGVDLIITSMKTHVDYQVPTLNGVALLTGINDEALKLEIKALLSH